VSGSMVSPTGLIGTAFRPLRAESDELLHLDLLRIVAAVVVVIYHFRNQWTFGFHGADAAVFENMSLAVDLFFLISGIVISYVYLARLRTGSPGEFWLFLRRRFARLAPLYYATLLFYLALGAVGVLGGERWKYRPDCLTGYLAFAQAFGTCDTYAFNHVSWSISAEMLAYLLFPLFVSVEARARRLLPLICVALLGVLWMRDASLHLAKPWHALTFDGGAVRVLPAFLIGLTLYSFRDALRQVPYARALLLAAAMAFVGGLALEAPRGVLLVIVYLIGAFAFAADLQGRVASPVRRLAPLGAITYGVYMLHPLVRTIGMPVGRALHLDVNLVAVINTALVFVAAYLSYNLFEVPMRRLLAPRRRRPATLD
jgi:peptidoglycan/LPS O-acetylase OafA/YrhL